MNPSKQIYSTIHKGLLLEKGGHLVLRDLMMRLFVEATKAEQIKFTTAFAKACFIIQKYQIEGDAAHALHFFRKNSRYAGAKTPLNDLKIIGAVALATLTEALYEEAIPEELSTLFPEKIPIPIAVLPADKFADKIRVVALENLPKEKCLVCQMESEPQGEVLVSYGVEGHNEQFNQTINVLTNVFGFPTTLNLIDVEKDSLGRLRPRAFVINPDYLVDISAIAECFKPDVVEPFSFLSHKFLPRQSTLPIVLGNVANYFLDHFMSDPEPKNYRELWTQLFREQPIPFIPLADHEMRDLYQRAQAHYVHLKTIATDPNGFGRVGISKKNSFIEPSFYSEKYGIQGRLDLFHIDDDGELSIVELKSGKPFKPNRYKISRAHFTQTLLYDLLVRSVFPKAKEPKKYILYSREQVDNLRYAPNIPSEQLEALQVRNHIITLEFLLTQIKPGTISATILNRLREGLCKEKSGFTKRDFATFEAAYLKLDDLERKYFNAFVGFIAREQWLSRIGDGSPDSRQGHANLWRSNIDEKEAQFSVMSNILIHENKADSAQPFIIFEKTDDTNLLANFRVGDMVVAYQAATIADNVMKRQVIRGIISQNSNINLRIELRQRQSNLNAFKGDLPWNLEPDNFDSGFQAMHRGLFEWASAGGLLRKRILGRSEPLRPSPNEIEIKVPEMMTEEQGNVFKRIIHAQGHFLLWGPPGTGKTSVMLRFLAEYWLHQTEDSILLLAFTNRAVDEICESLDSIGGDVRTHYMRIGSFHSTGAHFREQLLNTQIESYSTRKNITTLIKSKRIFVSTISSFSGKQALLSLKKFKHVVIDEASQLLEPQLVGLLTQFPKAVLIGDHKQLPAVSIQNTSQCMVEDTDLLSIGLKNLKDSYFERMYRHFQEKKWDYALGRLSAQGRMHEDIMLFPNKYFYHNFLNILPKQTYQQVPFMVDEACENDFEKLLQKRVVFIPQSQSTGNFKNNVFEAETCAKIIQYYQARYERERKQWSPDTLGVITPWRAQIAQIRSVLTQKKINVEPITIDTVERFQGGARDIIIISLCVNSPYQLESVSSMSVEGVDRKFNVALTRARNQIIVLGNAELLNQKPHFKAFIQYYNFWHNKCL